MELAIVIPLAFLDVVFAVYIFRIKRPKAKTAILGPRGDPFLEWLFRPLPPPVIDPTQDPWPEWTKRLVHEWYDEKRARHVVQAFLRSGDVDAAVTLERGLERAAVVYESDGFGRWLSPESQRAHEAHVKARIAAAFGP